jgi:hypothetical protein
MHTHWCDEYIERHENDDIYQEEIEVHQNFMVFDRAGLIELAAGGAKLLDEEACPSKKHIWKSKRLLERQETYEPFDAHVVEADSDAENFSYVNYLLYTMNHLL